MVKDNSVMKSFDEWTNSFIRFVRTKGKARPNEYPAAGYQPPRHVREDISLFWREMRMRLGIPRKDSTPYIQQKENINKDVTLNPGQSESENLDLH